MGRLRFIAGAIGIVVGFFVYQYGLFLALDHAEISLIGLELTSLAEVLVLPFGSSVEAGATFQIVGAVVAIAGLLTCISWLGSQPTIVPRSIVAPKKSEPDILSSFKSQLSSLGSQKCKFCGAAMELGAVFCPSCQRAQA